MMLRTTALVPLVMIFSMVATPAQVTSSAEFEVASVKKSPDPSGLPTMRVVMAEMLPGGVWRAAYATLAGLIREANAGLLPSQILGGQSWTRTEMFDIEARVPPGTSRDHARVMLQSLLRDRFKLRESRQMREMPVYLLELSRNRALGSGLRQPALDCSEYRAAQARGESSPPVSMPSGEPQPCTTATMPLVERTQKVEGANWRIVVPDATLTQFAEHLGPALDRPVVDRTGLDRRFDIEVQFDRRPLTATRDDHGPQLQEAVRDQLGLRLTSSRASAPALIIEAAEQPSAD